MTSNYERRPGEPLTLRYIPSATVEPVYFVKPGATLGEARTVMELNDFSQLPVLANGRLKGVVSWETIGRALARNPGATLADCTDQHCPSAMLDSELLKAIPLINGHGFVVATTQDKRVSGIVTGADLGEALAGIAGPYILLEKIETTIRRILDHLQTGNSIVASVMERVRAKNRKSVTESADELTLGELNAVLCSDTVWDLLPGGYYQVTVDRSLQEAVETRNLLMHFRELGTSDTAMRLEKLAELLDQIEGRLDLG